MGTARSARCDRSQWCDRCDWSARSSRLDRSPGKCRCYRRDWCNGGDGRRRNSGCNGPDRSSRRNRSTGPADCVSRNLVYGRNIQPWRRRFLQRFGLHLIGRFQYKRSAQHLADAVGRFGTAGFSRRHRCYGCNWASRSVGRNGTTRCHGCDRRDGRHGRDGRRRNSRRYGCNWAARCDWATRPAR